jgi:hypothetical protein
MDSMSAGVYKIDGRLRSGEVVALIVKLRDLGGSENLHQGGRQEVHFYKYLAGRAGVETPTAYAAEYESETGQMLLILEYLNECGDVGTINTNSSLEQIVRVTNALAGMHAKWWNTDELENLTSIRTFEQPFESGGRLFDSGVYSGARFIEQYENRLHPAIYDLYSSSNPWPQNLQGMFSGNRTLCHYDVAAKNLFLPEDLTLAPKFFDWSLITRGSIGIELAVIIAYSLSVEEHDRIPDVLNSYLETMHSLGITDLTSDTLWNDVRCGLLVRLAAPIALASRDYPPAHALALEILPRITSDVLATDALELTR